MGDLLSLKRPCPVHLTSGDYCELDAGHDGPHVTSWGVVTAKWDGDEPWSRGG